MPSSFAELKKNFKTQIKSLISNYLGYDLRKVPKNYRNHVNAFDDQKFLLKNREVKVVFDIGSHQGVITGKYKQLFPRANIYCFEPFERIYTVLLENYKNINSIKPYKLAISDQVGNQTFFINRVSYQNSLLPTSRESYKYVDSKKTENLASIEVKTTTIDEVCARESLDHIQLLKIDIQGGELLALKGAQNLLQKQSIDLVYTEVLFAKRYEGQANFYDLCKFLEQYDYLLYGLYDLDYGNNSALVRADAIFISPILEDSLPNQHKLNQDK